MANTGNVKGDIQPPEPEKSRDKSSKDVDEIKEKWSKVSKIDPDQRKKKKSKAQSEAEAEAEFTQAPRQGLGDEESKGPSIYDSEGKGFSVPSSSSPSNASQGPSTPPPNRPTESAPSQSSQQEPQEDDSSSDDQGAQGTRSRESESSRDTRQTGQPEKKSETPQEKKAHKGGLAPSEKSEKTEGKKGEKKKKSDQVAPAPLTEKSTVGSPHKKKKVEDKNTEPPLDSLPMQAPLPPLKSFESEKKDKIDEPGKKKGAKKGEAMEESSTPLLPSGAWESVKEEGQDHKEKDQKTAKADEESLAPTPLAGLLGPSAPTPPPQMAPLNAPFANLPPQLQQFFERMVGVMTVMNTSGITETTIKLNNPQFAKSPFYDTEIVIREFSTAPKQFNIELKGNNQAVQLITDNAQELVAAFQAGRYNFKVNRIDTSYLPPSSEIKRKEARRVKRKEL